MAKKTVSTIKPAAPAKRAVKPAAKNIVAEPKPTKQVIAKPKRVTKPKAAAFTADDVALRAYFISEKRRTDGLPGDEHQDWLEAERQLAAESKSRKKTAKS